jgi:hypothetical protein
MAQAAQEAGGKLQIKSKLGEGTKVNVTFQYYHIDRKPLGSMVETMTTLLLGNSELDISYTHQKGGETYVFTSQALKDQFKDRSPTDPEVIQWLRKHLKEGLAEIGVQG